MKAYKRKVYPVLLLSVAMSFLLACNSGSDKPNKKSDGIGSIFSSDFVDADEFKSVIAKQLPQVNPKDTAFGAQLLQDPEAGFNTRYAYQLAEYKPLWFDANGVKQGATTLTEQLNDLWNEGLEPGNYQAGYISQALTQLKNGKNFPLDSIVRWDKTFTQAWLHAAKDLLMGSKEIQQGDSLWFARNDTSFGGAAYLVRSLEHSSGFPSFDTFRPEMKEYVKMKAAVKQWSDLKSDSSYMQQKKNITLGQSDSNLRAVMEKELVGIQPSENDSMKGLSSWLATYQYYHQLRISGKHDSATYAVFKTMPEEYIHSLQMNMDRLRALPQKTGAEHVWVNIPLMEVNYYRDNEVKFHSRVVVGKKSRQTPSLWAPMANVVFNPPWGVPPTILRNDIGPGVGRSGAAYLSRKGLRAFDSRGHDVTGSVNGSNYKRYSYRQPPGAHNSLGEVKFNLPNKWDIYLHDTPHRDNFTNRVRALSSGCVRVQNPKMLAEAILEDRNYTPEKIDSIIETRKTKYEQLKRNVPVYIVYLTVATDSTGNQLRYLDDVYGRDKRLKKIYGF
jgi:murein L,D-transpeptidase YcbB/YkuD